MSTLEVAINASRARSGGGISHLVGILNELNPAEFDIDRVHVWSYGELLAALPDRPWLVKHAPAALKESLLRQLWWERFDLPKELQAAGCSILLNVDAGSVCRYRPCVTMSRDMLSYEPREMARFGWSKAKLRLIALRYVQNMSLRSADGAVFLTRYAAETIQRFCGRLKNVAYIPHGVGATFRHAERPQIVPQDRPLTCLYISNALPYKHQWHVVEAIYQLRRRGYDLRLELVGGGEGSAQQRLEAKIAERDPSGAFVRQHDFVPQRQLPEFLASADIFIFASSCENMPNTLVEAMASGLPIACAARGPMPEVLQDAGLYFDPEDPGSIASAVAGLVDRPEEAAALGARAGRLAQQYSWARCARETFSFMKRIASSAPSA